MSETPRKRKPHGLRAKISVEGIPEYLSYLRNDMAQLLREAADGEPEVVKAFALRVAAMFETGVKP